MSALSSVPFPSLSAVGTNALPNGSLTPPSTLRLHSRGHRHTLKRAHPRADLNTRDNVDMCQYCIPKCSHTLNTCTLQALMACQSSACTLMSGLGLTIHSQHCYTDTHAYTKQQEAISNAHSAGGDNLSLSFTHTDQGNCTLCC